MNPEMYQALNPSRPKDLQELTDDELGEMIIFVIESLANTSYAIRLCEENNRSESVIQRNQNAYKFWEGALDVCITERKERTIQKRAAQLENFNQIPF